MILVDTSVWVDYLRVGDDGLQRHLVDSAVLTHRWITGELAVGNLRNRSEILRSISQLPHAVHAEDSEVLALVERDRLYGRGIGWVDAHLLASARLTPGAQFWTRDKRLRAVALGLGIPVAG